MNRRRFLAALLTPAVGVPALAASPAAPMAVAAAVRPGWPSSMLEAIEWGMAYKPLTAAEVEANERALALKTAARQRLVRSERQCFDKRPENLRIGLSPSPAGSPLEAPAQSSSAA